jgi:hypothetical protein
MLKFSLKFDDDAHSLNKEDGLPFQHVGELLKNLYDAISPGTSIKCTLGQIRGNCYALDFYTEEEEYVYNFVSVHKAIEEFSPEDLEPRQRPYAKTLDKIIGSRYYVSAYDSSNKKIASIKSINENKTPANYFIQKSIYGVVSELGGTSLTAKKHIRIDGLSYKISISPDQDQKLKLHYGTDKLRLKIRERRSSEKGKAIDAELISFYSVGKANIIDSLSKEGFINFDLIKNTNTIDDIVNKIYGHSS